MKINLCNHSMVVQFQIILKVDMFVKLRSYVCQNKIQPYNHVSNPLTYNCIQLFRKDMVSINDLNITQAPILGQVTRRCQDIKVS